MQVHNDPNSNDVAGGAGSARTAPLVVGVGGSAGALPALVALLEALGEEARLAIVIVLHLSPDHESHSVEILQRSTPLVVQQVTQRTRLQAGHVYVIAPGTNLITDDGHIQPGEASLKRPSTVIDLFFRTLGEVHGENAIGVILSGTGRDGALGLAKIKECGGLTIGQALDECEHADMPRAAQASGVVDLMLGAADIGKRLALHARSPRPLAQQRGALPPVTSDDDIGVDVSDDAEHAFHDILTALRLRTRHDFRNYKRATLLRRLERRIQVNGLSSMSAYRDFVREHPEELTPLLADMLISVTNFFRDPHAFETLQQLVPGILASVAPGEEVRVWVPACASGEESYSMSMLLQEHAEGMPQAPRIQIFASDINEAALDEARQGVYPANIAADISELRLRTFFEEGEGNYRVLPRLRETLIFARHNVLSDPPFSRLDLICCRNLLIYLDRTAQAAVLKMFAYALKPGGYLFLGNAESIDAASDSFETCSKEHRIYRVKPEAAAFNGMRVPPRLAAAVAVARPPSANRGFTAVPGKSLATIHERALAATVAPSVLINSDHDIERVSPGAGRFVAFGEGAPTRNLLNNVPADIRLELRTLLFRAGETGETVRSVFTRGAADRAGEAPPTLALSLHPVRNDEGQLLHWLVLFDQASSATPAVAPEQGGKDQVERALFERVEDENRTLKLHLQDTLDRSAVSNEELKASNEELQAINEELMSAKEELETSKEELQSMNEELSTVNAELRMKVEEGNRNNDDLRNLMEASHIATIFVDPQMRVKRFTPQASGLFSLIASDVGRPLMDVKSRLNYSEIITDATQAFKQLQPIERSLTSVDNEHYLARILPYRTSHDKIGGAVLTFVDVTALRRAEQRVRQSEDRLRAAIASSKDFAVISTDGDGRILTWNEGAHIMFGYSEAEATGELIDMLFTDTDRARGIPDQERRIARREGRASDERWHLRSDGSVFFCSGVMTTASGDRGLGYIKIARDVSKNKHRQEQQDVELGTARKSVESAQAKSDMRDRFLAVMSHELKQPLNLILVNAELLVRTPEGQASPRVKRIGDTIMRAVAAQETIVNDLLDLSRVQTGKLHLSFAPTDVSDIVLRFSDAMAEDAQRKKVTLTVEMSGPPLLCICDPVRIEQVVWNLLGNAIKFTPEGGAVTVSLVEDQGHARLSIADTGVGISPEFLPNIFELFNQGDVQNVSGQRRPGLGIGLALVRELVQAHGGRITAESAGRMRGSTFTVCLPLRSPHTPCEDTSGSTEPLRCDILMVDDDAEALATLAALMEMEGAAVTTAASGPEALAMLAAGDYDVLVSDIGMPAMNGHELMRQARKLQPGKHFRSIALTGYGSEVDARDALEAGFASFLTKPITVVRLRAALEELLPK